VTEAENRLIQGSREPGSEEELVLEFLIK